MTKTLVNLIRFADEVAVINSYSQQHPILIKSADEQLIKWSEMFPNAHVTQEYMDLDEVVRIVAEGREKAGQLASHAYNIGKMSKDA